MVPFRSVMLLTKSSIKYWIIFSLIGTLCLGGGGAAESLPDNPSPSGPISVLLYHPEEENFDSVFRGHLGWLKQNGYQTISPETLVDYLAGEEVSLPPKPILLTFDDGTIENYEIVYPALAEFGFTGIAFVLTSPDFTSYSKRSWWKEADRSGILRIENHSYSHGLIWTSPQIVDFYSGDEGDYYLIEGIDSRPGAPIYEFDYELVDDRYLPDRRIANLCVKYVTQNGGEEFFKQEGWEEELSRVVENFRSSQKERSSYEKEQRRNSRLQKELSRSKKIIERTVGRGKQVMFFAYPWGAYDDELILRLKNYGYQGAFTTDWGVNFPGDDPFKIKRFVIASDMTVEDLSDILKFE